MRKGIQDDLAGWREKDRRIKIDDLDLWLALDKKLLTTSQVEWVWGSAAQNNPFDKRLNELLR
jgi:hypothetical protein